MLDKLEYTLLVCNATDTLQAGCPSSQIKKQDESTQ